MSAASFFHMHANTENAARNNTNNMLHCSLVRKRCACGRQVTAKQLIQHKCCETCRRASRVENPTS